VSFLWHQSAAFAHLLDGYKLLGFDAVAELANTRLAQAEAGAGWHGTARELWLCLLFEHRRERHAGMGTPPAREALLDQLCEMLRRRLLLVDGAERTELRGLLERFPFHGVVDDLNGR